jgi:hypothetical protein
MDKQLFERAFNALYATHAERLTYRAIFRAVYGADYPEEVARRR